MLNRQSLSRPLLWAIATGALCLLPLISSTQAQERKGGKPQSRRGQGRKAQQPRPAAPAAAPDAVLAANPDAPLPVGGVSLLPEGELFALKLRANDGAAEVTTVDAAGQPFGKARRVGTRVRTRGESAIALVGETAQDFAKDDTLFIRFWARLVKTEDESGQGRLRVGMESLKAQGPAPFMPKQADFGEEWERFDFPVSARNGLGGGQGSLVIGLGNTAPQTIEIGGLQLLNFGKRVRTDQLPFKQNTYEGREADAPWRGAAQERIEKIRKGDLTVRVTDAGGLPLPGATVQIAMTRHAYRFGTEYNPATLLGQGPDSEKMREWLPKLFNQAVPGNALKWQGWENQAKRPETLQSIRWLRDQGLQVRGHTLLWPGWKRTPAGVKELYDPTLARAGKEAAQAALQQHILDHIRDEAGALRGLISDWDVVNETFGHHDLMDVLGEDKMATWFQAAGAAAGADVPLYLNENGVLSGQKMEHFLRHARLIQDGGGPLGGVGEQGHGGAMPIPKLLANLDRLATLKVPIKITEFDIVTPDEKLQADWTRDYMTVMFSHPATEGFIMWGFWDGAHWLNDAPIFYRDWSLKPSGQAYMDLVLKQWWTNAQGATGVDGGYQTRGFLGDYKITVAHGGQSKTVQTPLPKEGQTLTIALG